MSCQIVIYLVSIALQVSGALILILFCWGDTERRVLNIIFPANASVHREEDDTVVINKEKLYRAHKELLLNKIAFIFICVGYLLSLFGENGGLCPWVGLVLVFIGSAIFVAFGAIVALVIAKIFNRKDRVYSYEEFCSKVDNTIVTNYTKDELDKFEL